MYILLESPRSGPSNCPYMYTSSINRSPNIHSSIQVMQTLHWFCCSLYLQHVTNSHRHYTVTTCWSAHNDNSITAVVLNSTTGPQHTQIGTACHSSHSSILFDSFAAHPGHHRMSQQSQWHYSIALHHAWLHNLDEHIVSATANSRFQVFRLVHILVEKVVKSVATEHY